MEQVGDGETSHKAMNKTTFVLDRKVVSLCILIDVWRALRFMGSGSGSGTEWFGD